MKSSLQPGLRYTHSFTLTPAKMVPALYPEAAEFQAMPDVFATGFMVCFLEWACIRAIEPHLDWPHEQSLGTMVSFSHEAATPSGFTVTANVELLAVEGRKLRFHVEARDEYDLIARGTHERHIIIKAKFDEKIARKRSAFSNAHALNKPEAT